MAAIAIAEEDEKRRQRILANAAAKLEEANKKE